MASPRKAAAFRVSLTYNRTMHRIWKSQSQWELWSEILDVDGSPTRIILGQLPSVAWAGKDEEGRWGAVGSITFSEFVRSQNIQGVLSIVEAFEWEHAAVEQDLVEQGVRMSIQAQEDFGGVDVDRLAESVRFMEETLRQSTDAKVYVHCKAGRGRSAAAVVAFLSTVHLDIRAGGPLDLATAHFAVRSSRPHINIGSSKVEDLHEYFAREVCGRDFRWPRKGQPEAAAAADLTRLHLQVVERLWACRSLPAEDEEAALASAALVTYVRELEAMVERLASAPRRLSTCPTLSPDPPEAPRSLTTIINPTNWGRNRAATIVS